MRRHMELESSGSYWTLIVTLMCVWLLAGHVATIAAGDNNAASEANSAVTPATLDTAANQQDSLAAIGGCNVFPPDHIWNVPVDTLPRDAHSDAYVATIGSTSHMHADFGSGEWDGGPIGIPFVVVPGSQPKVDIVFDEYGDESDPGPYPVPSDAPIEGGPNSDGDRHVLVVDRDNCILYELYRAFPQKDGSWTAGCGAAYNLNAYALREDGWTSADAAGLPIFPGLVRYDDVASGEIRHAIRFTAPQTQKAYVWPARHYASSHTEANYPPMGQRFRLKSDFDIAPFSRDTQVILKALKKYGMILADNGSSWYISGAPDERWDNDVLHELQQVPGSAFEAVDVSSLMLDPNSGRANVTVAVADFRAKPTKGPAPLRVQFTDKSRGNIVSWLWKFGDGSQSHQRNPAHRYKHPGKYSVTLRVTGTDGQGTSVKKKQACITVKAP